jgi:hypothetical protein
MNFRFIMLMANCEMVLNCRLEGHREGYFKAAVAHGANLDCRIVVLTVMFGASDSVLADLPPGRRAARYKRCNVALIDVAALNTSAHWTLVATRGPFAFGPRDSRIPKILSHFIFPNAEFIVYIDANRRLLIDPEDLVREHFVNSSTLLLAEKHHKRDTFEQEMRAVFANGFEGARLLAYQQWVYQQHHITMNNLLYGGFRMQRKSTVVNAFACLWFSHFMSHSQRDQLSLIRVVHELDLLAHGYVVVVAPDTVSQLAASHVVDYETRRRTSGASCQTRYKLHCENSRQIYVDMDADGADAGTLATLSKVIPEFAQWHTVTRTADVTELSGDKDIATYLLARVSDFEFVVLKLSGDVRNITASLNALISKAALPLVDLLIVETRASQQVDNELLARIADTLAVPLMQWRRDSSSTNYWNQRAYDSARARWRMTNQLRRTKA